ncbi:MAG: dihydrofolate reductase family protein [Acidobacteriota bacterium]|nr:dihydrofolate reductase family protein [Acidobacteriota bacterium]
MRKIIWTMSVSVDGYMEGPDHDISWHHVDQELHQHMNDWIGAAGLFLEGRVTYELMADFWPTADQDPDAPPTVVEFAEIWRRTPKVVYSRTLGRAGWNSTIAREVVPAEVLALKAQGDGHIVLGGSELGSEFARHDLIDEYRLYVHPVVIGRGTPALRPSKARFALDLVETWRFGNGVVLLRYTRPAS